MKLFSLFISVICAGSLAITLGACSVRKTDPVLISKDTPMTKRALARAPVTYARDPIYAQRGVRVEAGFHYDQPVALPVAVSDDDVPPPTPPAAFTQAIPVVLDMAFIHPGFTVPSVGGIDESLVANVQRICVYDAFGERLLAVAPGDGWRTLEHKMTFAHDIGSQTFAIHRLRFPVPAQFDQRLRDHPAATIHVVAEDAQGRVVSANDTNGLIDVDGSVLSGVRADGRVVAIEPDTIYRKRGEDDYWKCIMLLDAESPVGKLREHEPQVPDAASPQRPIPAALQKPVPLVLEITAWTPFYDDPPLERAKTLYVLGNEYEVLASISVKAGWYTRTNWSPTGGTGPHHSEVLRLSVSPSLFDTMRGRDYASATMVVVDQEGKTIVCENVPPPQ